MNQNWCQTTETVLFLFPPPPTRKVDCPDTLWNLVAGVDQLQFLWAFHLESGSACLFVFGLNKLKVELKVTRCRSWISDWVGNLMRHFIFLMWFCVTMVLEYVFYFFFYCFSFLSVLSTLSGMWHNILHFWILHFTELERAKLALFFELK